MSKKYYAIVSGEYSDYSVAAITDDKTKAEELIKLLNTNADKWCEYEIEEYNDAEIYFKPVWTVVFNKTTSEVIEVSQSYDVNLFYPNGIRNSHGNFLVYVRSSTKEGALKIANEKRVKYIAKLDAKAEQDKAKAKTVIRDTIHRLNMLLPEDERKYPDES